MNKTISFYKSLPGLAAALLLALLPPGVAEAQSARSPGIIDAGSTVNVRTTEEIDADESDGRVFMGVVDQDVRNRRGAVAIPRGSDVELVVRELSDDELAVDIEAVTVNGQRYAIVADTSTVTAEKREGIGINERTGKYVGGGALLGAIIGAIAGGGKGAAIGAGAGAAAGAGAQVLTRGKSVSVPAESLLTFRLQQPLRAPAPDTGFSRNGSHYHYSDVVNDTAAYRAGLRAGSTDRDRNLPFNARNSRWNTAQQRRDYEAGYQRGYYDSDFNAGNATAFLGIGRDNNITWQAPETVRIYVQVDNEPRKLFAEGKAGTQEAPWITSGHLYVFTAQDLNGNVVSRDRLDLR
jgi:hypothetical protein